MPNKYYYNGTYEEKWEEENRECLNDMYRSKTDYYNSLTEINYIILKVLDSMSDEEIKEAIKQNIGPVIRL